MDFIRAHNCRLTLGQGWYELAFNLNVTECVGGEELQRCARVAVIPPRSESLIPARLIDPCGEASIGVTKGQELFTRRSQLLVGKALVNLTNDVVPLRLFNPTDQPQTVYRGTIAALCEPVEDVPEASRKEVETGETPAGRACRVAPSITPLPAHLDDLYQRTTSCLEEAQKAEVAALLAEFADVFARSAGELGRTSIVKQSKQMKVGLSVKTQDVYPVSNGQWPRRKYRTCSSVEFSNRHPAHGRPQLHWSVKRMGPPGSGWIIAGLTLLQ